MEKLHLRIGQAAENHIRLSASEVADYHLELFRDADGNVFVTDLGSAQGTFVNGKRLDGFKVLQPGDHLRLGTQTGLDWERALGLSKPVSAAPNATTSKKESGASAAKEASEMPINQQLVLIYGAILILFLLLMWYI
ncbi:MAG: hypothetical protein RLZZ301_1352 [Bacteroidota bacterium]|jgi:pSer/pThr/pTyr-binding forkhead associated (FHA) protein